MTFFMKMGLACRKRFRVCDAAKVRDSRGCTEHGREGGMDELETGSAYLKRPRFSSPGDRTLESGDEGEGVDCRRGLR